ncbi:MAG: SDR family oxidoreductase, partial [Deltaproteobacteria bacterium]
TGGKSAIFVSADVRDAEQVEKMVTEVVEQLGRLDVLVNNAGGAPFAEAATASPRFSEKVLQLNLTAAIHCAQQANRVMQGQDSGGSIINIASVSGVRPSPGTAVYGAAKAGLINLTGTLAIEWAPKVRVNAISAGLIRTEQAHLHYGDEEGIGRVAETVPLKRLGTPEDIAGACLYFASPLASYVSGANLVLHGGGETPAFLSAASVNRGE